LGRRTAALATNVVKVSEVQDVGFLQETYKELLKLFIKGTQRKAKENRVMTEDSQRV